MLTNTELILRKAKAITDTDACGGRMGPTAVVSGVKNNVFPDWSLTESTAGGERLRKVFLHAADADGGSLADGVMGLAAVSGGDDYFVLFAGTQDDTAADVDESPDLYGAGSLAGAVSAGASTFDVFVEDAALVGFRTGDQIRIASADGTVEEFHEGVTVSQSGATVTVTLSDGDMLANDFSDGDPVSSCLPLGDVATSLTGLSVTAASGGGLDGDAVVLSNLGTIEQTVTLVFTSATAFTAASNVLGALGSGNISSSFAPVNSDFSAPLCTIPAAAWSGTFGAGDTAAFATHPACAPVWVRGVCPAGAAPFSGGGFSLFWRGAAS